MTNHPNKLAELQMKIIFTICFLTLTFFYVRSCTAQDYDKILFQTEYRSYGQKGKPVPHRVKWVYDAQAQTLSYMHSDSLHTVIWRHHIVYNKREYNLRMMALCTDAEYTQPVAVVLRCVPKDPVYARDEDMPEEIAVQWPGAKQAFYYFIVSDWRKE